ncbi:MAG: dienelactone hydrolase family protein [Rhodospirillales bacterium]|nr:dienelactone hydrolase family protein [Rhodospirillales bacterium]
MNRTLPVCGNRGNPPISRIRPFFALLAAVFGLIAAPVPALAQESLRFDSLDADIADGKPTGIEARLYKPAGSGPFPAIVAMHGCSGRDWTDGRMSSLYRDWAARLTGLGFVVLFPDSFKPRGVEEVCTRQPQPVTPFRQRPRDAHGALAWLAAQPYVRADRVFLIGWSHGGSTVLNSLDAGSRAPPRAPGNLAFRAAIAFYPGCLSPSRRRDWTAAAPLLILIGELDDWTPAAPCEALASRARGAGQPVELVTYPGAYHSFDAVQGQLRQRTDVGSKPGGSVTLGPEPVAREDARRRVAAFLLQHAGP